MTRREMNLVSSLVIGSAAVALMSGRAVAGPVPRIVHTLHGTVIAVDAIARNLTVQARRLEAWMGAITSIYGVESQKLLRQVKAGDQIMGKVYDGETTLHHVEIVAVTARSAPGA
jgi:Cu/Ag efflux protein CusF